MAYIRKRGAKWYYTIEIGSETHKRKEVPGGATRQKPRQPMLVLLSRSKSTAATSNRRRRRSRSFSRSGSPTM